MWKFLILVLLPALACSQSFVVRPTEPEEEIINNYNRARALLTPEQEEFLMELLAADDALIEVTSRGIVDEILQALSGTGGNIRVNIIGGSNQQQPQPPLPVSASVSLPIYTNNNAQQQQPVQSQPVNIINPTITLVNTPNNQEKALINSSDSTVVTAPMTTSSTPTNNTSASATPVPMPLSDLSAASSGASPQSGCCPTGSASYPQGASMTAGSPVYQGGSVPGSASNQGASMTNNNYYRPAAGGNLAPQQQQQMQMQSNVTTIGGNNNHLFNTISQVIRNSNTRNVTGIVDESLRIATPAPIREFVTGILNVVYCNGIRRLLGRC